MRYTGVSATSPIDKDPATLGAGNGVTATAAAVTPAFANDRVLRLYSDGATALSGFGQGQTGLTESGSANLTAITDAAGPAAGVSTGADTATTAAAQNWEADTVALEPQQGASALSILRPSNSAAGDFLLVTVTASGLPVNGKICAPVDATSPWTQLRTAAPPLEQGSGATSITQETFYSYRNTQDAIPDTLTFSFVNGASCTTSPSTYVAASAVAVATRASTLGARSTRIRRRSARGTV